MNIKWALFNTAAICRSPSDDLGGGAVDFTDSASIEAALFEPDDGEDVDLNEDLNELDDVAGASSATAPPVKVALKDKAEAELTDEDRAELAAIEAQELEAAEAASVEAAKADGEAETEQVYTVKLNGEEIDVTETELLAGYQRQQDYTQKTQAVADQRRAFETERQAEMGQLRNALSYHALPTAKEPRPEDFAGKPDQFMQAYGQWQQQSTRQAEAAQLLEVITADENRRTLEREAGLLQQAAPEWADETTRQADYANMMQAASERYGFTPEEVASATDHRFLIMLRDATRGAQLEAKPVVLKRKTEIKPKLNAGAKVKTDPNAAKQKAALDKLKSKGNISGKDAEALLFTE